MSDGVLAPKSSFEPWPDIVFDFQKQMVFVDGKLVAVGTCEYQPYTPELPPAERFKDREIVAVMEAVMPGWVERNKDRPLPTTPEVIHFTVLCGENEWWINCSLYLGDPDHEPDFVIGLADQPYLDSIFEATADDLLKMILETSQRTDRPDVGEYDSPFAGLVPGTWMGWDQFDPEARS